MTRHQYGISALVTQTSFCEGSSGDVARRRLFSQATFKNRKSSRQRSSSCAPQMLCACCTFTVCLQDVRLLYICHTFLVFLLRFLLWNLVARVFLTTSLEKLTMSLVRSFSVGANSVLSTTSYCGYFLTKPTCTELRKHWLFDQNYVLGRGTY